MNTPYPVKLSLTLSPINHDAALSLRVGINDDLTQISLSKTTTINFDFESTNTICTLNVEFLEKKDQEAIIIEKVDFFGIQDPRFAWAGMYQPQYPEPWATEQKLQGINLKSELCPHTYLSWPGAWTLTFSIPVFTWIHQTQSLGWIYN